MCGICGVVTQNPLSSTKIGDELQNKLLHRGPDSKASVFFEESNLFLGHTRLAIINPISNYQPKSSVSGRFHIVFNGEILNYKKIYPGENDFSDTDVLLKLWEDQREDCLKQLEGQFVFAIYDTFLNEITICSDQFGILPVYLLFDQHQFIFSSSLMSLVPYSKKNLDLIRIKEYLNFRYVSPPKTLFPDILRLPPQSIWKYKIDTRILSKNIWQPKSEKEHFSTSMRDIEKSIISAVENSLVSDVSLGIYLSGGLDSSLLAAIAKSLTTSPIKVFTAYWVNSDIESEIVNARILSSNLDLELYPVCIGPMDWWNGFQGGLLFRDSPYGEFADIAVFLLAAEASKHVKVVLSGEGADEIFYGYRKYKLELMAQYRLIRWISSFLYFVFQSKMNPKTLRIISTMSMHDENRRITSYFRTLWPKELTKKLRFDSTFIFDKEFGSIRNLQKYDVQEWLPNVLLDRADRMNMALGLESRPTFLTNDLFQISQSISDKRLLFGIKTKPILRKIAKKWIPSEISKGPKLGFPLPIAGWFRNELRENVSKILFSESKIVESMLPIGLRKDLFHEHCELGKDYSLAIFTCISLIAWVEKMDIEELSDGN